MAIDKQEIGRLGETAACEYLLKNGLMIIARNFRTPHGEIDIIARDKDAVIFLEVKTRSSDQFGNPEDAVDVTKASHMIDSAEYYLQTTGQEDVDWQLDVIAIELNHKLGKAGIIRYENAVNDE